MVTPVRITFTNGSRSPDASALIKRGECIVLRKLRKTKPGGCALLPLLRRGIENCRRDGVHRPSLWCGYPAKEATEKKHYTNPPFTAADSFCHKPDDPRHHRGDYNGRRDRYTAANSRGAGAGCGQYPRSHAVRNVLPVYRLRQQGVFRFGDKELSLWGPGRVRRYAPDCHRAVSANDAPHQRA